MGPLVDVATEVCGPIYTLLIGLQDALNVVAEL